MTNLLYTWIIPRSLKQGDLQKNSVRNSYGQLEGWVSIISNILLFLAKLVVGLLINSIALIADAIHSLSDVSTSVIVIVGYRISGKPADKEHPFGHQRAEYIATLIMAILLAVAGVEFIKASYSRLTEPQMSTVTVGVFVFIILTILAKAWLGRFSAYLGKLIDSQALKADALHHYTDSISSILVLVAVIGAKFGYVWFDGLGGIAVGIMLIWAGFSIAKDSADSLMGKPPTPEVIDKIKKLCLSVKGVINTHDIVVHSYGDQRFISVHVEVDQDMSSLDSHEIGDTVENELKERLQAYTTVHVDPIDTKSKEVKKANEIVANIVKNGDDLREFHDLRLVKNGKTYVIIFDLVPEDRSEKKCQKMASYPSLDKALKKAFPGSEVKIEIDPFYTYN